jgi:hypothetical protein
MVKRKICVPAGNRTSVMQSTASHFTEDATITFNTNTSEGSPTYLVKHDSRFFYTACQGRTSGVGATRRLRHWTSVRRGIFENMQSLLKYVRANCKIQKRNLRITHHFLFSSTATTDARQTHINIEWNCVALSITNMATEWNLAEVRTRSGVDKTKNNSGASIFFFCKYELKNHESNSKIKAPGKNFQAPWRLGALYLSTPEPGISRIQI